MSEEMDKWTYRQIKEVLLDFCFVLFSVGEKITD